MRRDLRAIAARLHERGAQALIVGCTELSLVVGPDDFPGPVYDALDILAQAAVRWAQQGMRQMPQPDHNKNTINTTTITSKAMSTIP
jgi:Asp/Glu/hydantoin racemase